MRKRKILKKVALFLALAVALNTSSLSVRALAEENDEEVQEISAEQPDKQIMDGQEQKKVEEPDQNENQTVVLEGEAQKPDEGEGELEDGNKDKVIPETSTPGWYQDGEDWYYYDTDGNRASGWRYIGNCWYYLNGEDEQKPGVMSADTFQVIDGKIYAFSASGAMRTGWISEPEGWYYAKADGSFADGWQYINGYWYYLEGANKEYPYLMMENTRKTIDDKDYYFTKSGAMKKNCWILESEGWYYALNSGALANGWDFINGAWYFFDGDNTEYPYLMISDCKKEINGAEYFFDGNGVMRIGWISEPEGWYYALNDGAKITGWIKVGTKWYYLDPDNAEHPGLMISGTEKTIAGVDYIFEANGSMRAGWYKVDDDWYYYGETSGQICSGWQNVGGYWYYLDPANGNRAFLGGWKVVNGAWYYFNQGGAMATNWLYVGGNWYYLAGNGAMRTGWQWIDNNWYYFYYENDSHGGSHGAMARARSIDGWQLQANGSMLSGKQAEMLAKAQAYTSNTNYLILVDRAACKVSIFAGGFGAWNNIKYWDCAPGKASTPTVSGTFTVQGKGYYFDSGSARCYWYTQFYGNYLFHSVLYSKYNGSLMDGRVGIPLSHGCVRLQIDNAKWIYDNIPRGTKVVIY